MRIPSQKSFLLFASLTLLQACAKDSPEWQIEGWELVWQDEFEGAVVDTSKWEFQSGDGTEFGLPPGWGNNELQWYRPKNAHVENGSLIITARKENHRGFAYSSARLRTMNKGDWKYGRFEIRAKLPRGQGLWRAIWMLPTNWIYGGWAASGEIDIMEMLGHEPTKVYGTLHYGGEWPDNVHTGTYYVLPKGNFSTEFHDFRLEWQKGEIRWYVDGQHYQTQTEWYSEGHPFPAPFDQPFHLLLNVAVGGNWPGPPDSTTTFPQKMMVDYVRVYRRVK